jgi:DNA-binding NtrC family response regulator
MQKRRFQLRGDAAAPEQSKTPNAASEGPSPSRPEEMAEESPTVATRSSATHVLRARVDVLPRLAIDIERESVHGQRSVAHQGDVCRIGTHSSNDVVLRDEAVSRFHCKLTRGVDGWRLRDSGSRNGTRLDGVRVRDADFGSEATITLGDSILHIRVAQGTDEITLPTVRSFGALLGKSVAMRKLFGSLERMAASEINVLIEGERGTGKELAAAELVAHGPRSDGPFAIVDCGGLSANLLASELFGHARSAFDGAVRDRVGAFESAVGGTVFLDEIGELPLEIQPKLLRAIEAREIRRVGETRVRKINVRLIAATNRDLEREVNNGRFREDLYFRLAVMSVRLPPLRERIEDLPLLIRGFLAALGLGDQHDLFPASVLADLAAHDWPGNVRELRNHVERTIALREPLPAPNRQGQPSESVGTHRPFKIAKDAVVDAFERNYVSDLLETAGGNVSRAARRGGMDRMYLHRLIQKHGLRVPVRDAEGEP